VALFGILQSQISRDPLVSSVQQNGKDIPMLLAIAVILAVLWLLGLITSYTLGGFIHVLIVLAIIAVLINVISGRKIA
jgi:hypothetical protein